MPLYVPEDRSIGRGSDEPVSPSPLRWDVSRRSAWAQLQGGAVAMAADENEEVAESEGNYRGG